MKPIARIHVAECRAIGSYIVFLSIRIVDFIFYVIVEIGVGNQVFDWQVHTVSPIVARICRHIDLLFAWVFAAYGSVD